MRVLAALSCFALWACATGAVDAPSLEPRAAESIDPRLPVRDTDDKEYPVAPELRAQLDALLAGAEDAGRSFDILAVGIVPMIESAGEPGSESWTAAAEQLSRLDAAREPVSRALADTDALATRQIHEQAWVAPSNRDAIAETATRIARIDRRQATLIDRLTGILKP